ncbi:Uncharacterised protein [uncultured archaeon]|nr:Uncharacterised protein [uncultured archaeon]
MKVTSITAPTALNAGYGMLNGNANWAKASPSMKLTEKARTSARFSSRKTTMACNCALLYPLSTTFATARNRKKMRRPSVLERMIHPTCLVSCAKKNNPLNSG